MPTHFYDTAEIAQFSSGKMNKFNLFQSPSMFCDVYCLEPGQSQKNHSHADNDKIYHVLAGTCRVRIDDQTRTLAAGQTAVAPRGLLHGVCNDSGQRATLLVVMAPHPDFHGLR